MSESSQNMLHGLIWLCGRWRSKTGDQQLDEIWMLPRGHTMLGMSRQADLDNTQSVEFLLLEQQEVETILTITLPRTGRIEKMRLVQANANVAKFEHTDSGKQETLIYQRGIDESLTVKLQKQKNDQPVEYTFQLVRVP